MIEDYNPSTKDSSKMDMTLKPYTLSEEEKATPVMIYTADSLVAGEVVTKKVIRVSTWLRTPMVPQFITVFTAQLIDLSSANPRTMNFSELYLPTSQVIALHMRPPASDPLDYDPAEPLRKMAPVTVLVGQFRMDGAIRMSTQTDLERYLDVTKETFTSLYDIEISALNQAAMKPFHVPFALLRRDEVSFAPRSG